MNLFDGLPFAFFALTAFIFGLLIGSFLNVVIYRVPRGESIAFPASHCGSCGNPVKPYDNIPLLSYAILGGRCRFCKAKISWIYPAVELLTGLLFLAVAWKVGVSWTAVIAMIFVAITISLVFIDARHQLLPNVITYPAFLLFLSAPVFLRYFEMQSVNAAYLHSIRGSLPVNSSLLTAAAAGALIFLLAAPLFWLMDRVDDVLFGKYFEWEEGTESAAETEEEKQIAAATERQHSTMLKMIFPVGALLGAAWIMLAFFSKQVGSTRWVAYQAAWESLLTAAIGALAGAAIIWTLRALYFYTRGAEGMGLGDVKLMAVIGAFLGWQSAVIVIILGSLMGSVVGLILARRSADGLKTAMPFGVFLGPASIIALFFGSAIVQWYVSRLTGNQ
jgi:leader peptidase (prepilin peptidase)/N-methyltransferase